MTAIEHRDQSAFVHQAVLYVLVFAALTAVAVLFHFAEERFGLLWREWLTGRLVHFYLENRVYLRATEDSRLSNPDQRITEDVRAFVTMTLSLFLMALNGTLTVLAFSGVLWSISRTLFLVGIAYAAAGSLLTVFLGRRLVALNYAQSDREADFRSALIEVRENAESIALHRRERQLEIRLDEHLGAVVSNLRRIIAVNRNLGFFTTGYNYMIQIIPALVVAPLFIRGDVEFGVITQSAMAFSHLLGAFSLVVTQFQAISSYGAVLARLNTLAEVLQTPPDASGIDTTEDPERMAYERLTLAVPGDAGVLVRELSFVIPRGAHVLVCSADTAARAALMRATAGVWDDGTGVVVRPPLEQLAFLPERAYLPPGTLREMMETSAGSVPSRRRAPERARDARRHRSRGARWRTPTASSTGNGSCRSGISKRWRSRACSSRGPALRSWTTSASSSAPIVSRPSSPRSPSAASPAWRSAATTSHATPTTWCSCSRRTARGASS